MSESEEIADGVSDDTLSTIETFEQAKLIARRLVGDETETILDNLAQAILRCANKHNR